MDPTYYLLLIFVPVPVVLLGAIIVTIFDGKKQPDHCFHHLVSEKIPAKSACPEDPNIEQPSVS